MKLYVIMYIYIYIYVYIYIYAIFDMILLPGEVAGIPAAIVSIIWYSIAIVLYYIVLYYIIS